MFKDQIKVQINPETLNAHLAIKVSDNHVHNFPFELVDLIYIISLESKKWSGWINGKEWTVQKLANHVKMYDENYEFHYRLGAKDMAMIRRQLAAEIEKHNLHKTEKLL